MDEGTCQYFVSIVTRWNGSGASVGHTPTLPFLEWDKNNLLTFRIIIGLMETKRHHSGARGDTLLGKHPDV